MKTIRFYDYCGIYQGWEKVNYMELARYRNWVRSGNSLKYDNWHINDMTKLELWVDAKLFAKD